MYILYHKFSSEYFSPFLDFIDSTYKIQALTFLFHLNSEPTLGEQGKFTVGEIYKNPKKVVTTYTSLISMPYNLPCDRMITQ
jgi:hypothetical protein